MNLLPRIALTIWILLGVSKDSPAQNSCMTLNQLIGKYYGSNNVQLSLLSKNFRIKNLTYRNGLATYGIQSSIDFSVPYSKSIESVLQPDGNSIYIERQYLSPVYTLSASKKIAATGGTIGVTSSLSYFKNFLNTNQQFNANWYNLFISQPFFAFNEYRYDKKLQQLTLSTDSIRYYHDREIRLGEFISKAIDCELLNMQIRNSELDIATNQDAFGKVKILFENGRMLAVDTLMLYNSIQQAWLQKDRLESELNIKRAALDYSLNHAYDFTICDIGVLMPYQLDSALLMDKYLKYNNQEELVVNAFISSEQVKRSRKAHGITTSVSAGNGINQSSGTFDRLVINPAQKQNVTLAVSVPITGWQTYRRNKEIAALQYQSFEMTRDELYVLAGAWVSEQLHNYRFLFRSYQLSKEKITGLEEIRKVQLEKILLGRANTNEYNITELSVNMAKLEQLNLLRQILLFRFELRASTLYDFELMGAVF